MLAQDVRALAANESCPESVRKIARALAERYSYPVDFQVIDLDGELFAQAAANDHIPSYLEAVKKGAAAKEPVEPLPKNQPPHLRRKR